MKVYWYWSFLVVVALFDCKNYHPALSLIIGALVLLHMCMDIRTSHLSCRRRTGSGLFDIFLKFKDTIIAQVSSAGIVIMILFGYSGYMYGAIGANQMAVNFW